MIEVIVSSALKNYFKETGSLHFELEAGDSVNNLLDILRVDYKMYFLENVQTVVELRRHFIVILDGRFALLDDIINNDSIIKIVPPISGG